MGVFQRAPPASRIDLAEEPEFVLGGLKVVPSERAIVSGAEQHVLQPRVMKVLVALAKASPAVVSRDRLVDLCWDGRIVGDDALNRCVLALRQLAQNLDPPPFTIETVPRVGHRLLERGARAPTAQGAGRVHRRKPTAVALALVALLVAAAVFLSHTDRWPWEAGARIPTVLVRAAANDGASRELARDLAAKLGSLQAVQPAPMRLIDQPESVSDEAKLLLQLTSANDSAAVRVNLVLTETGNKTVLWSKEFGQSSGSPADLKQQVAVTVARVLGCAAQGLAAEEPLGELNLKTYLNACAAMSDYMDDYRSTVRMLERLVESSPRFVPGWAKLLEAEAAAVDNPVFREGAELTPSLRRHVLAARKIDPDLPEAFLAEYVLALPSDFLGKARLLDKAVKDNPDHAIARTTRALFFESVGRTDEAVREAREAVRLDPLSPALRDRFVAALAYAGHTKAALEEVAKAERLWPGASSVIEARYRVHLRYGDPREALWLIRSKKIDTPAVPIQQSFLEARIDPSTENVEKAIRHVRDRYRNFETIDNYSQALAEFGRKEELFNLLSIAPVAMVAGTSEVLFRPAFREIHRDPRFMQVAKRTGLLKYWRTTGRWPDFCSEPDLPYNCSAQAARIAH